MDNSAIRYIGIARKAGAIEMGETNSGAAVRGGKAKLLVLASDASDNARSRAENFVYGRNTPLVTLPYTKFELSEISGTGGCSMAAFTDIGLAHAFMTQLAKSDGQYSACANELSARNEKVQQRKRETAIGKSKRKTGKAASMGKRRK